MNTGPRKVYEEYTVKEDWWRAWGFTTNPFHTRRAEAEELADINRFFVFDEKFYEILGTYNANQPTIFAAQRGCGKSAYRLMTTWHCLSSPGPLKTPKDRPVLAISYTEFSAALSKLPMQAAPPYVDHTIALQPAHQRAVLEIHVRTIVARLLVTLFTTLQTRPDVAEQAQRIAPAYMYRTLRSYCDTYAEFMVGGHFWDHMRANAPAELQIILDRIATATPDPSLGNIYTNPQEVLSTLVGVVNSLGFSGVYLLIDGLDEWTSTVDNPDLGLAIIMPLLATSKLLEESGITFKFFLTYEVYNLLMNTPVLLQKVRIERWHFPILVTKDDWPIERLVEVLNQRVSGFHPDGLYDSFSQIAAPERAAQQLAEAAYSSPRNILILAHLAAARCSQRAAGQPIPIGQEDIDYAIDMFSRVPAAQRGEHPSNRQATLPSDIILEENGSLAQFWQDDHYASVQLSPSEMCLLNYLFRHRGRVCTKDELSDTCWSGDGEGVTDEAILRAMARLRQKVEQIPGYTLETVRGRGFKLL